MCNNVDRKCVTKVRRKLKLNENNCDCFPSCSSVKYELKLYTENWFFFFFDFMTKENWINHEFFSGCSAIAVGFENDHFRSFIKTHKFGTSELLASIGGFLSLIGGISVISLFEIFYFLGCRKRKLRTDTETVRKSSCFSVFLKKHCNFSSIHGLNNISEGKVFG